ncbi:hypothetical protein [Nostoc sp.]
MMVLPGSAYVEMVISCCG